MNVKRKRRRSGWGVRLAALTGLALAAAGCKRGQELEARTFRLEHLDAGEAVSLIDPYVYGDREGAPGAISSTRETVTVRELPENLDRIAEVLREFDRPRPAVRLDFMVIEADGFAQSDPTIAEIEGELRQLFNFQGYRLAAKTTLQSVEHGEVQQTLGGGAYHIEGMVWDVGLTDGEGTLTMEIRLDGFFATTVTVPLGQTVVLGSGQAAFLQQEKGVRAAILVVTPRLVEPEAGGV